MQESRNHWRLCSSCRTELPFGEIYWVCSVSTCNRKKMPLTFCSLACWEAHLPMMRHRDAWAEERRAPTRRQWEAERAAAEAPALPAPAAGTGPGTQPRTVTASNAWAEADPLALSDRDLPREVLIIASRLKQYVRARAGMNTSDGVLDVLSDLVRHKCDEAIRNAGRAGRKTVLERDVQ